MNLIISLINCTFESVSSIHLTGKSNILYPILSAKISSSVSKNHSLSLIKGTNSFTALLVAPLNPHWASVKFVQNNDFIIKLNEKKADYFKYLKYSFIFIIIVLAPINYINLEKTIDEGNFLYKYEKGALWLKNNAPKGSLVFINAYAFNYLFFYNSDVKYTHGIDLTYSYLYDADKFERYMDLLQGKDFDYNVIKTDYNPDYVFIGKIFLIFLAGFFFCSS